MAGQDEPTDLARVLRAIRRRLGLVLACVVLVPAAALVFSLLREDQYSATATLHFREVELDEAITDAEIYDSPDDDDRAAGTNLGLVSLDRVTDRTALRLEGISGDEVEDSVSAEAEGESDLISVTAEASEPRAAQRLANTFAEEFVALRVETDRDLVRRAERSVQEELETLAPAEAAGEPGRLLSERLRTLRLLAQIESGNVQIAGRAGLPSDPSSPRPLRDTAIGLFLGMLLGIGAALVLYRFDRRLREPAEAQEAFGRPLLASVPRSGALSARWNGGPLPKQEAKAFQLLRTNVRYASASGGLDSVLITSTVPGEGKTTVAWNLSAATAAIRAKVLLIEADLRRPSLGSRLDLPSSPGLSGVLARECPPGDAVQRVALAGEASSVDVIVAGPTPPNPADLVDSEPMRELISDARREYDLVVVDGAAASQLSEVFPLVPLVGGVVVVAGLGHVSRDAAAEVRDRLSELGSFPLGVVVNYVGPANGSPSAPRSVRPAARTLQRR